MFLFYCSFLLLDSSALLSDPMLLIDRKDRAFAALAGRPPGRSYAETADQADEAIRSEGRAAGFLGRVSPHLRGHFPAINAGAMHGKGTLMPINLDNKHNNPMVARLVQNPHIRRMAAFASGRISHCSMFSIRIHEDLPQLLLLIMRQSYTTIINYILANCSTAICQILTDYFPPMSVFFRLRPSILDPTHGRTSIGTPRTSLMGGALFTPLAILIRPKAGI